MERATIFAPATGKGPAGIAIVRISGPRAGAALGALAGCAPVARHATRARLSDPASGAALDDGLVLWFPAPASMTGEDVAELHIHGGRASVDAVCAALARQPGLRLAEPGEFTRRAFDNGKLELTAVEGLADLIAAETEEQRRQALRQLDGELGRLYEGWRAALLTARARIEAEIDFPDEDLPGGLTTAARAALEDCAGAIERHLADARRGERLRDGIHIAIIGPPNAGKSSLLNALARREAAIVSGAPGTTRDVIEVHLDLGGYPVVVADTAGLRRAADGVEAEGVRRALARAETADFSIMVLDAADGAPGADITALIGENTLVALNKIDLVNRQDLPDIVGGVAVTAVSVKTGENLDALLGSITDRVAGEFEPGGGPPLTRLRHRAALGDCRAALQRALDGTAIELIAEDVRLAARALGRITGRVDVEDVLDEIFGEFCIGK
ncbi:MAG: tRNA uridine-5-carboxymethylaminomethyl(34) synthesis GTPase MnmE [Alphaproteobacteria bacterium]